MARNIELSRADHGPVESFMEHEARKFHPALVPRTSVDHDGDDEMEGGPIRKPKETLLSSVEKLKKTLANFKKTIKDPLDFDISDCPWTAVAEQLEEAIKAQHDRDHAKTIGINHGKAREVMSKALKIAIPAQECIPGEVGLSVLKGGLACIFTIARLRGENANKIVNTFQNIPDLLVEAEEARLAHMGHESYDRNAYKTSFDEAIEELYLKLANGLKKLIHIFTQRKLVNYVSSALKGDEIDNVNDGIMACMNRVRNLDGRLFRNDMRDQVHQIHRKISNSSELNAGYSSEVSEMVKTMRKDIKERASEASIKALTKEIQDMKDLLSGLATEGLTEFLQESLRQFKNNRPVDLPMDTASQFDGARLAPATDKSCEALVHSIGRNAEDSVFDVQVVMRKQGNIARPAETEARTLWQSPNFLGWLNSRRSEMLFVLTASAPAGRTSALSIVCAMLAVTLLGEDYHPFSAHFFCGEHTKMEDELAGPEGMVCSLIVQIAVHLHAQEMLHIDDDWAWELAGMNQNQEQQGASRLGILLPIFGELLKQLPESSTLFLILDGVSHYAADDMVWVMKLLMEKAFDKDVLARVKFLLTGPTRSDELIRGLGLDHHQVVKLNRGAGPGGMPRGPQHLRPPNGMERPMRRRNM